ncbi:MAG: hypothetical protein JW725_02955 [Candidatus Babeliaceae bacterium]|nr:hypothetical protein [Candidatus Babeliaceae bacterium]
MKHFRHTAYPLVCSFFCLTFFLSPLYANENPTTRAPRPAQETIETQPIDPDPRMYPYPLDMQLKTLSVTGGTTVNNLTVTALLPPVDRSVLSDHSLYFGK